MSTLLPPGVPQPGSALGGFWRRLRDVHTFGVRRAETARLPPGVTFALLQKFRRAPAGPHLGRVLVCIGDLAERFRIVQRARVQPGVVRPRLRRCDVLSDMRAMVRQGRAE